MIRRFACYLSGTKKVQQRCEGLIGVTGVSAPRSHSISGAWRTEENWYWRVSVRGIKKRLEYYEFRVSNGENTGIFSVLLLSRVKGLLLTYLLPAKIEVQVGDSSSGRTTDSGSVSRGSNPRSPARSSVAWRIRLAAKDTTLSRWRPRVRIPYALPTSPPLIRNFLDARTASLYARALLALNRCPVAGNGPEIRRR